MNNKLGCYNVSKSGKMSFIDLDGKKQNFRAKVFQIVFKLSDFLILKSKIHRPSNFVKAIRTTNGNNSLLINI